MTDPIVDPVEAAREAQLSNSFIISVVTISMVLIVILGVIKNAMDVRGAPWAPSNVSAIGHPEGSRQDADAASIGNSLKLVAKPWNDGYVHLWSVIIDGPEMNDQYKDIHEGTVCTKLDDESHVLGSGSTAIYYFKVNCNGAVGFVEVDQG